MAKTYSGYLPPPGDRSLALLPNDKGPGSIGIKFNEPKSETNPRSQTRERRIFSVPILTDREAWAAADRWLAGARGQQQTETTITVMEVFDGWCNANKKVRTPADSYAQDNRKRIVRQFGNEPVTVITDERLTYWNEEDTYFSALSETTRAGTINTLFGTLTRAQKKGLLPVGYSMPVDFVRPKLGAKHTYLPEPEEERLWAICEGIVRDGVDKNYPVRSRALSRWRAALWCLLGLSLGGRGEAIDQLSWPQVAWDEGDDGSGLIYLNPQGRKQNRKFRATPPIMVRLRPVLELCYTHRRNDLVLVRTTDTGSSVIPMLAKLGFQCIEAGTQNRRPMTRHDFRRTFATLLVLNGASLEQVADLLGDSYEVTKEHYAQFVPGNRQQVVAINVRQPRLRAIK